MQSQNGVQIRTQQFDVISEAANLLKVELAGVNHKLDRLDEIEDRKGTMSRSQELEYDLLVDRQFEIDIDLAGLV